MLKQNFTRTRWLHIALSTLIILFSLGINNAWADYSPGSGYTLVTNISSLSTGDYVILFCIQNGEGVTGFNGTKDATVSSTAANWKEYYVTKSTSSFTLKDGSANKFIAAPGGNEFKYGNSGGACTVSGTGLLTCSSRYLFKNGNYYRFYATSSTYTNKFYVYKKSASCDKKVALTKGAETNGSFSLNKSNGSYDNCDNNFEVVVSSISPNSGYVFDEITVSEADGKHSITGPDGSGNYTVTYTKGNSITSTINVTFKAACLTPTFSPVAGVYTETQTVTISCATTGATIYYTTDGNTPTTSSSVYSTPLTVSSTTTIKAIAVKAGLANSEVASGTFTIKNGKIFQLVTKASDLAAGDELVILGVSSLPAYYLMSTTQNSNNRGKTDEDGDWEFVDDDIFVEEKLSSTVQIINLEGSAGAWYLNVGTDAYLYAASSSSNYLRTTTKASAGDNGKWAIAIGSDPYNATVTAQGTNTHNLLQYNQSNAIFSCYGSAQQNIRIYRYANTSPTVTVGTPTSTSFSYVYDNGPSSTQTFTISGSNLTGNVVINAPSNYKIKKGSDNWSSSITLTPSSGTIASTTISIQLVAGLDAGSYNGNITFTNNDGLTISPIALTGTVSKANLNPSFGEATYTIVRDVSTSTTFTLTNVPSDYTGDITYQRTNSPTYSSYLTVNGSEKTFTASSSGSWTVTAQFAADANYNAKASGVTCTVNAVMRDTYVDNVNGQSVTEAQRTDDGVNPYTSPSLSDVAAGSACKGTKTHLIGWATATFIANVGNGTLTGADSDYTQANGFYAVGETLPAASGATYYAVYGEEE